VKVHVSWILIVTLALALAVPATAQSGSKTLATVNGQNITEADVNKLAATDLENLEMKRLQAEATYNRDKSDVLERSLNQLVEDKLLAAEAAKRKVTPEELLQSEVNSKATPPAPEQIKQFFDDNRARIPPQVTYEQAEPQLREYLIGQRIQELREEFFTKLKKDYAVTSFFEPVRFDITTAGFPARGPANASVTIVEFSDFQCPFCGNLYPVMKEIETKYKDTVRIVYRQFPLNSIHPFAQKAAEASLCAKDQNKFWEYHDSLFENQQALDVDALKTRAVNLQLDTTAFNQCLDSGRQADAIRKDIVEGNKVGVTGTPALYINGKPYREDTSFEALSKVIDAELQRKSAAK
jgi:predicted DsbA family dithiol-disulfide isomerase/Skp family chaperone for outer membrane proteins